MAPPRKSELIARELADSPPSRLEAEHFNPHVLRRLLALADDSVTNGSGQSLRLASLCCRIAHHLKTDETRARSFARLASALRRANRLEQAECAMRIALACAPPHVEGDLLRRRSTFGSTKGALARHIKTQSLLSPRLLAWSMHGRWKLPVRHSTIGKNIGRPFASLEDVLLQHIQTMAVTATRSRTTRPHSPKARTTKLAKP